MAFTITLTEGEAGGMWIADRRLWLTKDGELVEDGDGRAAFLFCTPGYSVPIEAARARGLIAKEIPMPEPEKTEPEKQAPKPRDKQAPRARDKARSDGADTDESTDHQETNP